MNGMNWFFCYQFYVILTIQIVYTRYIGLCFFLNLTSMDDNNFFGLKPKSCGCWRSKNLNQKKCHSYIHFYFGAYQILFSHTFPFNLLYIYIYQFRSLLLCGKRLLCSHNVPFYMRYVFIFTSIAHTHIHTVHNLVLLKCFRAENHAQLMVYLWLTSNDGGFGRWFLWSLEQKKIHDQTFLYTCSQPILCWLTIYRIYIYIYDTLWPVTGTVTLLSSK